MQSPFTYADNLVHPNHKAATGSDDSIAVSSSIGVASQGDTAKRMIQPAGIVEDLLANESNDQFAKLLPPPGQGQPGLAHAAVLDTDRDLLGAESDNKFSLSKLKKPVSYFYFKR